jgi:LPS-assembly lipoprotein
MLAALALGGCGFTPLYATNGAGDSLAAIAVADPLDNSFNGLNKDRVGFLLKQSLRDEFASRVDIPARYTLTSTITERRYARGIRVNNVSSRYEINLTVAYTLTATATNKVVIKGSAPVIVNYDAADPPYAGTIASQDGDERAAQQAAILIRLQLGRYFAGRPAGGPGLVETPAPPNPSSADPTP